MRNLALMWVLAGCLLGCGGREDSGSDGLTWYCGQYGNQNAIKATLKNGTLTVSGKGEMKNYRQTRTIFEPGGGGHYNDTTKDSRAECWSPWSFTLKYDSTVSITDVVIEDGVAHIGNLAFACLPELKSITIPASVTYIGEEALLGYDGAYATVDTCNSGLKSITVAADNARYSSENGILFNKNKTILIMYPPYKQQDAYTIPNSVTDIGEMAFYHCENLTSVTIPNSVTNIGESAFHRCKNLTSVTIPDSVKSIGMAAFALTGLTSVTIPDGVKHIQASAFFGCKNLTSVTIPNSVGSIGEFAFDECISLTSITIPTSVWDIGWYAFSACTNLRSVIVQRRTPPNANFAFYDFGDSIDIDIDKVCLYVPKGSIAAYRKAGEWRDFKCIKAIESAPE
jgi:hypothetical protein